MQDKILNIIWINCASICEDQVIETIPEYNELLDVKIQSTFQNW
jgi:hypothetical protein